MGQCLGPGRLVLFFCVSKSIDSGRYNRKEQINWQLAEGDQFENDKRNHGAVENG